MLSSLKTTEQQLLDASEGFSNYGSVGDARETYSATGHDEAGTVTLVGGRRVMFKPKRSDIPSRFLFAG